MRHPSPQRQAARDKRDSKAKRRGGFRRSPAPRHALRRWRPLPQHSGSWPGARQVGLNIFPPPKTTKAAPEGGFLMGEPRCGEPGDHSPFSPALRRAAPRMSPSEAPESDEPN